MRDILDPVHLWIGTPGGALVFGNKRPVAVDDPLVVPMDSGPVSIDVLDNDFDPEGGPLTLVSAVAALGTAVAESDNTVTYTPPAGIIGFDTVVYEIADDQDQRRLGQINVTISEIGFSLIIETETDNTLSVTADPGALTITVTLPLRFAGTYPFDAGTLTGGPVNLVPPGITGALTLGTVLTAETGLWVHDSTAGIPSRGYQWRRGGADIAGENGPSHTVQSADLAAGVSLVETLTDAFGARSAESATVMIAAFQPSDDPLLLGWWDASDTATITTSAGNVTAWADKASGAPLAQTSPVLRPTSGTRTYNGLNVVDFGGNAFLGRAQTFPATGDVAFHGVFLIDSIDNAFEALLAVEATADFQLDANNAAQFDGRLNAAGIGAPVNLSGGPFSGPFVLSILFDRSGSGTAEVFISNQMRGQAGYTTPIDTATELLLMTNRSKNAFVDGAIGELILSENITNRADHHAYLAGKWGVT